MINTTQEPINKFVIVGGGTAGWIAAATLARIFHKSSVSIELVESNEVGIVGVGEATIPPLLATIQSLGIDEVEFIKATQATFKWGIKFEDWHKIGESYFHPFGSLGKMIDGHDFYQCWLKARAEGDQTPLMAHSPESVLSDHNKFYLPFKAMGTPLAGAKYALHLDSVLVGQYLRKFSENLGVKRIEGHVNQVSQNQDGFIEAIILKTGEVVGGDFFIDCTGVKGVLIEKTLKTGYEDWSHYLPCNKAVTVQTEQTGELNPYTISKAQKSGWTWRIPLQHRTGNGYVFCDKFCTEKQAVDTLLSTVDGSLLTSPKVIPFTTGMRKKAWNKNCLALGLAQGFVEPLESTAIHLVSKTLAFFVRMFPDRKCNEVLINEFNRRVRLDYEEIRDFLVLHYCTTARDDSEFWRWCKQMKIPNSLQRRLDFFKEAGGLMSNEEALFQSTSWYAVFTGMGVIPEKYNSTIDALDYKKLALTMLQGKQGIINYVRQQPSQKEFIQQYCLSNKPS